MTTQAEQLDYVFNEIFGGEEPYDIQKELEKLEIRKWFCHKCNKEVKVVKNFQTNGIDDTDLTSVVCAECGLLLWQD